MRIKSLFVSTVFVSAFLMSPPMVTNAVAQKGGMLMPSSNWAINKVASQQQGQGGYCALARQFEQNTILTVARNLSSESSLAIDFQQPKFSSGREISVVLDPGAGQLRNYDVLPVSRSAFVVRLGLDDEFFSALQKTGYLRAEINNEAFNFNLSDIDTGNANLQACVVAMTQPAAGDELTPVFDTKNVQEQKERISALEKENDRLRLDLAELKVRVYEEDQSGNKASEQTIKALERVKKENERLKAAMQASEAGDLKAQLAALQAENQKLKQYNVVLSARESAPSGVDITLVKENQRLQEELDNVLAGQTDKKQQVEQLQQNLAALRSANDDLEAELDEARAQSAEGADNLALIETMKEKLSQLQEENGRLNLAMADLTSVRQAGDTTLKGDVDVLKAENQALLQQMQEDRLTLADLSGVRSQNQALAAKVSALTLEKQALLQEIEEVKGGVALSYEEKLKSYETENKALRGMLDERVADGALIKDLRQKIANLTLEKQQLQEDTALKQQATLAQVEKQKSQEFFDLSKKISDLQEKLAEAKRSNSDVGALKKSLDQAVRERDTFEQLVKEQGTQISALRQELGNVQLAQNRIGALEGQLQDYDLVKQALNDYQEQVSALGEENLSLKGEIDQLVKKYELALLDKEATSSEQVAALQEENKALNAKVAAISEKVANYELALADLDALKADKQKLADELALAQGSQEKMSGALSDAIALNEDLKTQLSGKNQDLASYGAVSEELAEVSSRKAELEALLADAQESLKQGESKSLELAALKSEVSGLEAEKAQLQEELAGVKGDLVGALAQVENNAAALNAITPAAGDEPPMVEEEIAEVVGEHDLTTAEAVSTESPMIEEENLVEETAMVDEIEAVQEEPAMEPSVSEEKIAELAIEPAPAPAPEDIQVASVDVEPEAFYTPLPLKKPAAARSIDKVVKETIKRDVEKVEAKREPVEEKVQEIEESAPVVSASAHEDIEELVANVAETASASLSEAQMYEARMMAELQGASQDNSSAPVAVEKAAVEPEVIIEAVPEIVPETDDLVDIIAQSDVKTDPAIPGAPTSLDEEHVAPVAMRGTFQPPFSVDNILSQAQMTADAIQYVEQASGPDKSVHQWHTDNVYGSSEQMPMSDEQDFDTNVLAYLEKTQARCPGEFAVVPDDTVQHGDTRIDSYEVACVADNVSSSASLLFFNKEGTFTAVAHEAPTEEMSAAMSLRDRLMKSISGS